MGATPDPKEGDELDISATLVVTYEEKHFPIANLDPIAAIHHKMESLGITRKEVEPILDPRNRVSEILNRKRKLTMTTVEKLHKHFGIPANILIQDYKLNA